jgi:hypothetical protein
LFQTTCVDQLFNKMVANHAVTNNDNPMFLHKLKLQFQIRAGAAAARQNITLLLVFFGEAVVVTQEVDDIISSPVVKEAIINNSDCKILLDQRKYMNKFDHIQKLLGLTDKERGQILSINQANHPGRIYREVWIGLGGTHSAVYATEVSEEEYAIYTTEESEKLELQKLTEELDGNLQLAVRQLANRRKAARNSNLLNQDNHE